MKHDFQLPKTAQGKEVYRVPRACKSDFNNKDLFRREKGTKGRAQKLYRSSVPRPVKVLISPLRYSNTKMLAL